MKTEKFSLSLGQGHICAEPFRELKIDNFHYSRVNNDKSVKSKVF